MASSRRETSANEARAPCGMCFISCSRTGPAGGAATRAIQSILFETKPLDPAVFAAVTASLLLVAMLACLVPAWRASRLNPMQALRAE